MEYRYYPDDENRSKVEDRYIAKARGFASVDDWIEFRDATPERRSEIVRERETRKRDHSTTRGKPEWEWDGHHWHEVPEPDDDDQRRYAEVSRMFK